MPNLRADGLFDRTFLYHVYDHPNFVGVQPFTAASIQTAGLGGGSGGPRDFYCLRADMDALRQIGAAKTITPSPGATPVPLVDATTRTVGTGFELDFENTPSGGTTTLRQIWALKIGIGQKRVLVTGCHHAREWISVELPYLLAEYLINNFTDTPTTDKQKRIKHLLLNREVWIVPMVNPDGHRHSVIIDREWRANRSTVFIDQSVLGPSMTINADDINHVNPRTITVPKGSYVGVDINRNYNTSTKSLFPWGLETYDGTIRRTSRDPADGGNGPRQIWTGLSGKNQPESRSITDVFDNQQFHASLSYHSFGQDFLYPDEAEGTATRPKSDFVLAVAKGMEEINHAAVASASNLKSYRSVKGSDLYPDTGDLLDFAYDHVVLNQFKESDPKHYRLSFLPEVRPESPPNPPSRAFSGLPDIEILPCFLENLGAALAVINCAGFDSAPASATCKMRQKNVCQVVLNCWEVFKNWQP
jgi:hypothetical protein